jgi:hypothetical protein
LVLTTSSFEAWDFFVIILAIPDPITKNN